MASSVKPKSSTSILVSEANSSVNASENISAKYPAETHEKAGSDEVENNTRKALCVLETRTGSQTWGTLFEANSGEQILHLLIGIYPYPSQSVIAPDDLYEAVLKFSSLKTEMCIQSRDSIRHVWCTQHLKAVVVELSSEAANECRSRGANFLKVGIATVWEEVTVWWWWRRRFEPFADELFVPIGTRVHVESVNAREASLLLPELIASYRALRRRESGGLGDVGECACVTNSSGEALAVLPLRDVEESARRDTPFELRQLGIDINPQMYQYRGKVTLLAGIVKAYIEEERPMRITLALLKPLSGLSEQDFKCSVCLDIAENVIECAECHNIFCEKHKDNLTQLSNNKCSCCSKPLKTIENHFLRRLIAKLEMPCSECRVPIPRGDLATHKLRFCSKRSGSNISEVSKLISPVNPPNTIVSEKIALEAPLFSEHQLNQENKVKECAEFERLLKTALRVAHKQRPLDSNIPADDTIHELFEYIISILIAMEGAVNIIHCSLKRSTNGEPSEQNNLEEECQRTITGLCALITHLNSLRGTEYRQQLLRLAANEPNAEHTSKYSDIFHLIQEMNIHLTAMAENAEDECHKENILKAISDTIYQTYQAVQAIFDTAQSTIDGTQEHTTMTYLKSSVSTETAQKEDAVVKMSPIGGNEEISKASSNPEAVDWKIRSKTDRENIATSQCSTEKDFERLLRILENSPHKLPQEAVKDPTEDTIRQLYDNSKTNLSELRTALNDLNLFIVSSASTQVPGTPASSTIKDNRDRAAVSLVSIVFLLNALRRSKHQLMAFNTKEKAEQVLNMIIALNEELAKLAHQHEEEANQEELLLTLANSLDKYLIMFSPKARALIG